MQNNYVRMTGNLATLPELTMVQEKATCYTVIAVDRPQKVEFGVVGKEVDFHRVTTFDQILSQELALKAKGDLVTIEGYLLNRQFESNGEYKYITEIIVTKFL